MTIKGRHIFLILPSAVGGLALSLGRILAAGRTSLSFGPADLVAFAAGTVTAYILNLLVLRYVERHGTQPESEDERTLYPQEAGPSRSFSKIRFLLRTAAIFACWFPVLLAYYPGIWSYDIWTQLPYTTHSYFDGTHPIIHTLFIELFMLIGRLLGSYETGIVLMSLVQMALLSLMFSYCVEKTAVWGTGIPARLLLTAFYALMPFCSILSISTTKDILFTGVFLLLVTAAFDIIWGDPEKTFTPSFMVRFVMIGTLFGLLRSNGIYVLAGWAVLGPVFAGKKRRLRFFLLCLLSVAITFGADHGLRHLVNATDIHRKEALSVPIQCFVGTALRHPELIPPYGNGELLFHVFPRDLYPEDLEDAFKPCLADPAKHYWGLYLSEMIDIKEVVKTWVDVGLTYPSDYVDICGTLTLGAWYPYDTSHAEIYKANEYLLTDFKEDRDLGIIRSESRFPALKNVLDQIAAYHVHQDIPVVSLLFAPATYVWILIAFCAAFIALLRGQDLFPLIPAALLFGTVLLGPCILVRYMFPFMTLAPLYLTIYSARVPAGT